MEVVRKIESDGFLIEDIKGNAIIHISEKVNKKELNVSLEGSLTTNTVHEFEDEMVSASIIFEKIVLDFEKLEYLSNSVLKFILQLQHMQEEKNGELIIKNVGVGIFDVFKQMELEDVFDIQ